MSTWAGAIVHAGERDDFAAIAAAHGITVTGPVTPWVLVQCAVDFQHLRPPDFAAPLSRALDTDVIAFFVQTTASVEQVQHFKSGELVRELAYGGDDGWSRRTGKPQPWEAHYFFADDEGTAKDRQWPSALPDEISEEDVARYERAKAAGDPEPIVDLLMMGSVYNLRHLCAHFGVDPDAPSAHCAPPRTRQKWPFMLLAIVALLVLAFTLGVIFQP